MLPQNGKISALEWEKRIPDFIPKTPRNLWSMPRLDSATEGALWEAHMLEFYDEIVIERLENDNRKQIK
jgi:hypothetical protein